MQRPERAAGTLYDIGYRRYEGPRRGRGYAFGVLFAHSLKAAFGIGRGARAKVVPFLLLGLVCFPAMIQSALGALSGGEAKVVGYEDYFKRVVFFFLLWCAAQAPELVSGDQHHRVLSLYFSRALRRVDYALAKLLAFVTAAAMFVLAPQLLLFVANVARGANVGEGLRTEGAFVWQILAANLVSATIFASAALAIASLTPRRAFATASAMGLFLLTGAAAGALVDERAGVGRRAELISPIMVSVRANERIFSDAAPTEKLPLPTWTYLAVAGGLAALSTATLLTRYQKVQA